MTMQTTKRRMSQKEQVAGIVARTTRSQQNEFGGVDYRGPNGVARTAVDDNERLVMVFTTNMTLVWRAVFDLGVPEAAVAATWQQAQAQVDAK